RVARSQSVCRCRIRLLRRGRREHRTEVDALRQARARDRVRLRGTRLYRHADSLRVRRTFDRSGCRQDRRSRHCTIHRIVRPQGFSRARFDLGLHRAQLQSADTRIRRASRECSVALRVLADLTIMSAPPTALSLAIRRLMLCIAIAFACPSLAEEGPSPYPTRAEDWPGVGVIRVFDFMTDNRQAFWRARERARNSIVFAGDSLTASWRSLAQDFPEHRVANRGIGGDVSRGLLFRFEEDVLALDPKAIVILIGTNDLTARQDASKTLANVRSMLRLARDRERSLPVLLCTVPPSADPKAPIDEKQREVLNQGLRAIAHDDPHVVLVDLFAATATPDGAPNPR